MGDDNFHDYGKSSTIDSSKKFLGGLQISSHNIVVLKLV